MYTQWCTEMIHFENDEWIPYKGLLIWKRICDVDTTLGTGMVCMAYLSKTAALGYRVSMVQTNSTTETEQNLTFMKHTVALYRLY